MVFSSLLFLYVFLPLQLIVYRFCKTVRSRNGCLLIFSLLFYSWTGPKYVLLLLVMVLIHYGCSNLMGTESLGRKRFFLILGIGGSLVLLGYFKYAEMICRMFQVVLGDSVGIVEVALPVGISFYTFQLISYLVDVYRGEVEAQRNYFTLLLYASLYHQCIAGPIVRYRDVEEEIRCRRLTPEEVSDGISRFTVGLAKKTLLANTCAALASSFAAETAAAIGQADMAALWLSNLMYMLEIYLDFSAYSDMAIGLGLMSGFHYKENFNYPYMADSITDFWRRWHMSLSSFFRDYVYIPLGGNRKGAGRQIFNMFVVWGLTGLWHGAHWNFVVWGLYFFCFLTLEKTVFQNLWKHMPGAAEAVLRRIYALLVIFFGWVIFRFSDAELMFASLKGLLGAGAGGFCSMETWFLLLNNVIFILAAVIACTPAAGIVLEEIQIRMHRLMRKRSVKMPQFLLVKLYSAGVVALPVVLLFLSTIALAGNSFNPFLYFQF
ncbi:MAG: MBOAT family O-acyltransferase [Lachnospiraceae bacterium]|nr:MBOAT family O-acyltransferase [Lachnospiraceae bacterium]